jgi:predicted metal-dependent hydrolase
MFSLPVSKLPYIVRKSRRTKRHKIIIGLDKIEVVIPYYASKIQAERFMRQKQNWVETQWKKMQNIKRIAPVCLQQGAPFLYQGKTYYLSIDQGKVVLPECYLGTTSLHVVLPHYLPAAKSPAAIRLALQRWLTLQLEKHVQTFIAHYSPILNVAPAHIAIKQFRSRWGSCNHRRVLHFNFHLIFVPTEVLEYVVVHELCHLRHMNHSQAFWEMVASVLPNYNVYRKWFRDQHGLICYFPSLEKAND